MYSSVLIAGVDTAEGAALARSLEEDPRVELIVGLTRGQRPAALKRTQVIPTDQSFRTVAKIVRAAEVEAIVHLFARNEMGEGGMRELNENNVIGTMNLLAAAGSPGSSVRHVVVRSYDSVYPADSTSPAFIPENHPLHASTPLVRTLIEAERYVKEFADDNPHVVVTLLRHPYLVGPGCQSIFMRNLLSERFPVLAGFDPTTSLAYLDDFVEAILYCLRERVPGIFNVAGEDPAPISMCLDQTGVKRVLLPPYLTGLFSQALKVAFPFSLSEEFLIWLKYGRGLATEALRAAGFKASRSTLEAAASAKALLSA